MGVIAWIVLGVVAGLIAENLTGKRTGPLLATVIGIYFPRWLSSPTSRSRWAWKSTGFSRRSS
jgi:hypothetical protein